MKLRFSAVTLALILAAAAVAGTSTSSCCEAFSFINSRVSLNNNNNNNNNNHRDIKSTRLYNAANYNPFASYYGNPANNNNNNDNLEVDDHRYAFGPPVPQQQEQQQDHVASSFYSTRKEQVSIAAAAATSDTNRSDSSPPPTYEAYLQDRQRKQQQEEERAAAAAGSSSSSTLPFPLSTPSPHVSPATNHVAKAFKVTQEELRSMPSYMSSLEQQMQQSDTAEGQTHVSTMTSTFPSNIPSPPLPYMGRHQEQGSHQSTTVNDTENILVAFEEKLDRLYDEHQSFGQRLSNVETKFDQQKQEQYEHTKQLLEKFKSETEKTTTQFVSTVTNDISKMQSTLNRLVQDQSLLSKQQQEQATTIKSVQTQQQHHGENLTTLEKTHNIRMNNFEKAQADLKETTKADNSKLEEAQRRHVDEVTKMTSNLAKESKQRMSAFEEAQVERLTAFEEYQSERMKHELQQNSAMQSMNDHHRPANVDDEEHNRSTPMLDRGEDERRGGHRHFPHMQDEEGYQQDFVPDDMDDEEGEKEEYMPKPRGMLRDRLMKKGGRSDGEQLYRKTKEDPVVPPTPMGPTNEKKKQRSGLFGGHNDRDDDMDYSGRGGGPFDDRYDGDISKSLGSYRSFQGDEQLPTNPFPGNSGMGRYDHRPEPEMGPPVRGKERTDSPPTSMKERTNIPTAAQEQRDLDMPPKRDERKPHLTNPPETPVIDRKLQHFLQETVQNGPKPHIDKAMESLIMEKYQPTYSWLKPSNAQFLCSVLTTTMEHNGAQVEMDLRDASEQAAYEWDELMNILSLELKNMTGTEPRIVPEGNNQWGIYSTSNRRKLSPNGVSSQQEKERKKQLNKKSFVVSEGMGGGAV